MCMCAHNVHVCRKRGEREAQVVSLQSWSPSVEFDLPNHEIMT